MHVWGPIRSAKKWNRPYVGHNASTKIHPWMGSSLSTSTREIVWNIQTMVTCHLRRAAAPLQHLHDHYRSLIIVVLVLIISISYSCLMAPKNLKRARKGEEDVTDSKLPEQFLVEKFSELSKRLGSPEAANFITYEIFFDRSGLHKISLSWQTRIILQRGICKNCAVF